MNMQERRQHSRYDVVVAVMLTPNGDQHHASVMDLSEGGARVGLSEGWLPPEGMPLRVLFQVHDADIIALQAKVTRVGADHMGVEFDEAQDIRIQQLLRDVGAVH